MSSHFNRAKNRRSQIREERRSANQDIKKSMDDYDEESIDLAYIEPENSEDIIQRQCDQMFAERDKEIADKEAKWRAEEYRLEQEYYDQAERQNINDNLLQWLQYVEDEKNIDNFLNGSDEDPTM